MMDSLGVERRVPCGVELQRGGAHARVWAPAVSQVSLIAVRDGRERVHPLRPEAGGYHAAVVEGLAAGDRYWFGLGKTRRPDPCSRYQPDGPHGPSALVDPGRFRWTDQGWTGVNPAATSSTSCMSERSPPKVPGGLRRRTFPHWPTWASPSSR